MNNTLFVLLNTFDKILKFTITKINLKYQSLLWFLIIQPQELLKVLAVSSQA